MCFYYNYLKSYYIQTSPAISFSFFFQTHSLHYFHNKSLKNYDPKQTITITMLFGIWIGGNILWYQDYVSDPNQLAYVS